MNVYSLVWSTIFIRALVVPQTFLANWICVFHPPSPQTFYFFDIFGFFLVGFNLNLSSSCFASLEASLLTSRNGINYREALTDQGKWKKFMATWQGTGNIPDLWSVASGSISDMFPASGAHSAKIRV